MSDVEMAFFNLGLSFIFFCDLLFEKIGGFERREMLSLAYDIFLLMLRAVFSALCLTIKLSKPTFSPYARLTFKTVINCSIQVTTVVLSMPFVFTMSLSLASIFPLEDIEVFLAPFEHQVNDRNQ